MADHVYHLSPYFTFTWTMSFRHAIFWNLRHTPTSHSIVSYCQLYLPLCSPEMVGFLMKYIKSPYVSPSLSKEKQHSWNPHDLPIAAIFHGENHDGHRGSPKALWGDIGSPHLEGAGGGENHEMPVLRRTPAGYAPYAAGKKPWLVGGYTYSEKWWSLSVGMMTFPTEWKHKSHVPNHQPDDFGAVGKSSTKHWWKSLAGRPFPSCAATEMAQLQAELNVKYLAGSSPSIDWNKARKLQLQLISPRPPSPATLKVIVDIGMDKFNTCRWFPPKKITWSSSVSVKPGTNIGV